MSDHSELDEAARDPSPDHDPVLGDLVARYLDRLNDGQCLNAEQILQDEPEYGPAILEEL